MKHTYHRAFANFGLYLILQFGINFQELPAQGILNVKGRFLFDACHNKVVMRGIEHCMYRSKPDICDTVRCCDTDLNLGISRIAEIGKTGANAIRVLAQTDAAGWDAILHEAVIEQKMFVSVAGADFADTNVKAILDRYKDYITIHAQGEVGYAGNDKRWISDSKAIITKFRGLGYKVPLEILSSSWGQSLWTVIDHGQEVFDSDPERNIVFGVQMYSETRPTGVNHCTYKEAFQAIVNAPFPIWVGTCPFNQYDAPVDGWKIVWQMTQENEISTLYWDWFGTPNIEPDNSLTTDGLFGHWTDYGKIVCEPTAKYSFKQTVVKTPCLKSGVNQRIINTNK